MDWGRADPSSWPRMKVGEENERWGRGWGEKNNGICCSERSGRVRRDWTVDLGNVICSERKTVYIIACKIRAILCEDLTHYGLPDQQIGESLISWNNNASLSVGFKRAEYFFFSSFTFSLQKTHLPGGHHCLTRLTLCSNRCEDNPLAAHLLTHGFPHLIQFLFLIVWAGLQCFCFVHWAF